MGIVTTHVDIGVVNDTGDARMINTTIAGVVRYFDLAFAFTDQNGNVTHERVRVPMNLMDRDGVPIDASRGSVPQHAEITETQMRAHGARLAELEEELADEP